MGVLHDCHTVKLDFCNTFSYIYNHTAVCQFEQQTKIIIIVIGSSMIMTTIIIIIIILIIIIIIITIIIIIIILIIIIIIITIIIIIIIVVVVVVIIYYISCKTEKSLSCEASRRWKCCSVGGLLFSLLLISRYSR